MASTEPIAPRVIAVIADTKRLPVESVTEASTFEQLKIDSLDALNIAFALEDAFQVSIPDDELRGLKTVGDAVRGVEQLIAAKQKSAVQG